MSKNEWIMLLLSISVVIHGLWISRLDYKIWAMEQKRKRRPWNDDQND